MKKKGFWTGLLACLAVCLLAGSALGADPTPPPTSGTISNNLSWMLDEKTGVLSFNGSGNIPGQNTPDDHPWHDIRDKVKSVTVSSGVTGIGQYAFSGCTSLTSVTLPDTVTIIDSHAFSGCTKLGGDLKLPGQLKQLNGYAFSGCTSLTGVTFPMDTAVIGKGAFSGCTKLGSVTLPHALTTVSDSAFANTGLTSVQLPIGLTAIEDGAFQGTKLTDVFVPETVTSRGYGIFDNCSNLGIIHFGGTMTAWGQYEGASSHTIHYTFTTDDISHDYCNRENYREIHVQCNNCSKRFNLKETIPMSPHATVPVPAVPATCTTAGQTEGTLCTKCGFKSGGNVVNPLGHSLKPDPESLRIDPTCTEDGADLTVYRCSRFEPDGTPCPHYEIVSSTTIDALGHKKPLKPDGTPIQTVTILTKATCIVKGSQRVTYQCDTCKKTVTVTEEIPINPDNHDHPEEKVSIISQNTCTDTGLEEHWTVCTDCNTDLTPQHEFVPTDALGHKPPDDPKLIEEQILQPPTCGDPGLRILSYTCTRPECGQEVLNDPIEIPPTGKHKPIVMPGDEQIDPTCASSGFTEQVTCEICRNLLKEREIIPRDENAHPEESLQESDDIIKDATCTEDGSQMHIVSCPLCGQTVSETIEVIKATDHDLDENNIETKDTVEATCTTPGTRSIRHYCLRCDKYIEVKTEVIPPKSAIGKHTFGEWTVTKQPTGTEPGEREHECQICHFKEKSSFYNLAQVSLDSNGGTLPEGSSNKIATNTDGKLTANLPVPVQEGYIFTGWFTEKAGGTQVYADTTIFPVDTTLYAHWTKDQIYTVTLDANEGTLGDDAASLTTGSDGKLAALPKDPTRDGFLFDGWFTAREGGDRVTTATVFTGDTTIYAHWTKEPEPEKGFTITLDAGGGTLSGSASVKTGDDGKLSALPAAPAREGYDFDGWFTASEGGVAVTTATVFQSDATIYARWSVIDTTTAFPIRIGSVTGGVVSTNTASATRGTEITVLVDPDSGYALDSIRVTASGGTAVTLTKASDAKYTFTMPGSAVDVTATFKSTGSGGSSSGNNGNNNNSGGAVWNPDINTNPNPEPVPVKQSVPQATASNQIFLDIPVNHWAAGEISWAFQQGYMNGTGGGSFSPDAPITHSQLWTVLTRLLRSANISESNLLAIRSGLLDGGSPTSPATRQELVTALHRCAYLLGGARTPSISLNTYADAGRVAGYAKDAMAWAVTNGIISGTTGGRLNPEGIVSRAQFAVILYRFTYRM